jgi:hypothetical protein
MVIRKWLKENNYTKELALVDTVEAELKASGSKQRRNWWDAFAGANEGTPIIVNGHEFPVLRAAQIRQGKPVTKNAICKSEDEVIPPVKASSRFPRRRLPSKARKLSRNTNGAQKRQQQAS